MRGPDCRKLLLALAVSAVVPAAGCGEDDPPPPPPARAAGQKPVARPTTAARPGAPTGVVSYRRVEEVVQSDAERRAIRHRFAERDFAIDVTGTENRDPFRSYVINQPGIGAGANAPAQATEQCPRTRQFARSFSARDLKLVGIVSKGTIRYALFSDAGQKGYVIRAGDCVGKEKARVKEIGAGFVTLEIAAETAPNQAPRPAEQRSIQLHPKDLPVGGSDDDDNLDSGAPADLRRRSDELLRGDSGAPVPPIPADPGPAGAAPPPPPSRTP